MADPIHNGDAAIAAALEASTVAIRAVHEASDAAKDATLAASKLSTENAKSARAKTWWQVSAQVAMWLVIVLLAYGTINTRLQVLEVKYDRIAQDISEMRADVKMLLQMQRDDAR